MSTPADQPLAPGQRVRIVQPGRWHGDRGTVEAVLQREQRQGELLPTVYRVQRDVGGWPLLFEAHELEAGEEPREEDTGGTP
jgi:hypothetical protein